MAFQQWFTPMIHRCIRICELSLSKLELCAQDIVFWMVKYELIRNSSNTDIIHYNLVTYRVHPLQVSNFASSEIKTIVNVRDLGVTLDHCLMMSIHVNIFAHASLQVCTFWPKVHWEHPSLSWPTEHWKTCTRLLPPNLTTVTTSSMVFLIHKSLRFNVYRIQPLDWLQNHFMPIFRKLHWVPVHKRTIFKILLTKWFNINLSDRAH